MGVIGGGTGQGDQHFIAVQPGVVAAQIPGLEDLDGLQGRGGDQFLLRIDAGAFLDGVHQGGGRGAEQGGGPAGDQTAVPQFDGAGRMSGQLLAGQGRGIYLALLRLETGLLEQQLHTEKLRPGGIALLNIAGCMIIAAQDLLPGRFPAYLVIADGEAYHIDAHIGGGTVGALAQDAFEHGGKHRENLHIAVIVDGGLTVGFHMEGIDHVDVVQVCCRRLVSDIDGMAQGQIPDGEGLELGVSGLDAPLVLMIELGQAGGHLAAAGTGSRDDDQIAAGLYIVIAAKALVAEDVADILRIAVNDIVQIGTDPQGGQLLAEFIGRALACILGNDDAGNEKASGLQGVLEAQDIYVIGDAQIAADLVLFNS